MIFAKKYHQAARDNYASKIYIYNNKKLIFYYLLKIIKIKIKFNIVKNYEKSIYR